MGLEMLRPSATSGISCFCLIAKLMVESPPSPLPFPPLLLDSTFGSVLGTLMLL